MQQTLFDQAEMVAQQLNLSQSHLFERAVAHFIRTYQNQAQNQAMPDEISTLSAAPPDLNQTAQTAMQTGDGQRAIKQGDIYWLQVEEAGRSAPGYPHPHVVIQDDAINGSRISTVVVCALTSNLKRGSEPGNIVLEVGEANLSRQSVIVVSQIDVVNKTQLGEYIGSLSKPRVEQILAGMRFQQMLFSARYQAR